MNKQVTLSAFSDELAQVRTKKKEFLPQIDRTIPWGEWITLTKAHYYKGERGSKPYDFELMLRIYLLQNLYDLSDEETQQERSVQGKEGGTRKVIRTSQGRTCLWCGQAATEIQEDPIPGTTEANRQIQYHVRTGESDPG